MKNDSHNTLTGSTDARRVGSVVELSTQSAAADVSQAAADRIIVASPGCQQLRKKYATYLQLARLEVPKLRGGVPSYLANAIDAVFAAFDQWEQDEQAVKNA